METASIAPSVPLVGDNALVPKSGGTLTYQGTRPTPVPSWLHRIYSAIRPRKSSFAGQNTATRLLVKGCKERAMWPVTLQSLEGTKVIGAASDLCGAFDTLALGRDGILWTLAENLKFPSAIAAVMKDTRNSLKR